MRCFIGVDDTDSQFGHCTTHLGFQIVTALTRDGCTFETYPRLVRLNPNVPFKTRGNAAVCLEFECKDPDRAFDTARLLMLENADVKNGANSGMVFIEGEAPGFFRELYSTAISGLVNYRKVLRRLREDGIRHSVLGNGMGVVGAGASIGFRKEDDHTYELIAYRRASACGTPRVVDTASVVEMEKRTFPMTFNSYDHGSRRTLISPHGPDPVFLGIRAGSPEVAIGAFALVRYSEGLAGYMIYLSNQCTDAHLSKKLSQPLRAYHSGRLEGIVDSIHRGKGGHVYVDLLVEGSPVRCAVYAPSGDLCKAACLLAAGDRVRVFGGVRRGTTRHRPVVNVERIDVLSAPSEIRRENPLCGRCGTRMKSEGAGKGFQCRSCGAKRKGSRIAVRRERSLVRGVYLPSAGGQRHLTMPLVRYGSEASEAHALVEGWFVVDQPESLRSNAVLDISRR